MCKSTDVSSNFGGVDELVEVLKIDFGKSVIKVESKSTVDYEPNTVYVSTRILDPSLEYSRFAKIIFVRAENLMASPDYLVNEDVHRSLAELMLQIDDTTEVVFDTANPDLPFFIELAKLNSVRDESKTYSKSNLEEIDCHLERSERAFASIDQGSLVLESDQIKSKAENLLNNSNPPDGIFRYAQDDNISEIPNVTATTASPQESKQPKQFPNIFTWYTDFVQEESKNRQRFQFPPFDNLILLTTQEKSKEKSIQKINSARQYLFGYKNELKSIIIGSPYQAKFLKRKGMFSHHLLVKFPRQYPQYFELRDIVKSVASTYNLQARLNPRHLF